MIQEAGKGRFRLVLRWRAGGGFGRRCVAGVSAPVPAPSSSFPHPATVMARRGCMRQIHVLQNSMTIAHHCR